MTITAQTSKTGPYSGNGTTTVFSYTFEVQDEAHLVVTLADASGVETVQVLNTDYTVSGVGNANGGQITMSTAPASTYTLTISRNIPITQEVDLENRRSVAPEVLEDAYDKLTQIAQDLSEQLGRAIKISVTEGGNPTLTLEGDVQPGTFLGFDAAGNLAQLAPASGTFISPNAAIVAVDDFTGNGTTVDFTLGGIPQSPNNLFIFLDGVMQDAANYTVSGTTLTFTTAPPLNTNIEVRRLQAVALTGGTTADLVTYSPAGSGAVNTTVETKLREFVSVKDFGAVGDGVTDDTAALKAFFDHCILTGQSGYISAGTYMIQLGQLAFDNGFTDTIWPAIKTDGYFATQLKAISNIDAPFISITNGTATGPVDKVWRGGELGSLRFVSASGSTVGLTNMHGLLLQGLVGCNFGYMRADNLGGSTVHIKRALFGGNNPDPYQVSSCNFEAVVGVRNQGAAFYNDNFVGFNGCHIKTIRGTENVNGVFFGMGAGTRIDVLLGGSSSGWAIGDQPTVTGGGSTRFSLGLAELDDVQYGIDTSICANSDFGIVRFVHRYNFGPYNPSGGYWPRTALKVGSPARPVVGLRFYVIDRIEASVGTKGDLGVFADFTNAGGNLSDVHIDRQVLDNAGFGITNADLFANFSSLSSVRYRNSVRTPIIDTIELQGGYVRARNSGAVAIPSGGFLSGSNWVAYDTQVEGNLALFDNATYEYTAPGNGVYRISAALNLTLSAGNRVRMAIYKNGTGILFSRYSYAVTANTECHTIEGTIYLNAGDTIKVNADQNSGAPVTTGGTISANENYLIIERI